MNPQLVHQKVVILIVSNSTIFFGLFVFGNSINSISNIELDTKTYITQYPFQEISKNENYPVTLKKLSITLK